MTPITLAIYGLIDAAKRAARIPVRGMGIAGRASAEGRVSVETKVLMLLAVQYSTQAVAEAIAPYASNRTIALGSLAASRKPLAGGRHGLWCSELRLLLGLERRSWLCSIDVVCLTLNDYCFDLKAASYT